MRAREGGAAARDDADLDRAQRALEGGVVERQRAFEEGGAGERAPGRRGRPAAAAPDPCTASLARSSRFGFTSVASMLREVSMRDDQVDPLALHLLPVEAPLRPGQRDDQQRQRGERAAPCASARRRRSTSGVRRAHQRRLGERAQQRRAPAQQDDQQQRAERGEQPEQMGHATASTAEDGGATQRREAVADRTRPCPSAQSLHASILITAAPAATSAPASPRRRAAAAPAARARRRARGTRDTAGPPAGSSRAGRSRRRSAAGVGVSVARK